LVFVIISGSIIFKIDPEVKSIADGVWWALATVTTIGYGDVVPHSNMGRLFGGVLILLGVALFSLLTANISAFLINKGVKEEEQIFLERIGLMEGQLKSIQKSIDGLKDGNQSN
jgi:voltage-gated potassium channel